MTVNDPILDLQILRPQSVKQHLSGKLRFNIANLERKNQKRRNSIVALSKKASEGQLSAEEEVALQRNKINLAEGEEKLVRLNERLSYML